LSAEKSTTDVCAVFAQGSTRRDIPGIEVEDVGADEFD
jgi:hypothetical protein